MQALAQCLWSIEERSDWGRRLCSGCDEPEVHMKSQGIDSIGQIVGWCSGECILLESTGTGALGMGRSSCKRL